MPSPASEQAAATKTDRWTTRSLLRWMIGYFEPRGVDSPRVVAEMLLSYVIGCERMRLYMDVDRPASPMELETLRDLVRRAGKHEPVQYLVGHASFFSREFEVNRSTLIPRPSTETVVEHVLQWLRASGRSAPVIADIGTGSGCIAISLAAQLPNAHIIATDIVLEALELAQRNADKHNVADRIEFREGVGLERLKQGLPGQRFDCICSNPPYISDAEWEKVDRNVRDYEPESALRAGPEGMDVIDPLIAGAAPLLEPGGQLVIEIGHHQKKLVLDRIEQAEGLGEATVLTDHEDFWRVLVAFRTDAA